MTAFQPLEARDVVLADKADALVGELVREVDELTERMHQLSAEIEAAEERAERPGDPELSQSAQLTLQFVDDLVATNRERMREVITQRYEWVGQRLTAAEAEAHAITNAAVTELTSALAQQGSAGVGPLDHLAAAQLVASIVPPAPSPPGPADVPIDGLHTAEADESPDRREAVEAPAELSSARDDVPTDVRADDPIGPSATDAAEVDRPVAPSEEAPPEDDERRPVEPEREDGSAIDDVVGSAVQAVLRALTEPGAEAPRGPSANGTKLAAPPPHLDWILPDPDLDGSEEGSTLRPQHDFWSDEEPAAPPATARFRPRDLVISMVALVLVVLVALLLVG